MSVLTLIFSPLSLLIGATSFAYFLYRYGTLTFGYFKDQGVPGPKPIPYVGNLWGVWKWNLPNHDRELVKKYGRTLGHFDGTIPNLWTTDVGFIRSIFVKDFDHFINRRETKVSSKIMRKMILLIKDQTWKDVRSAVTPVFTSGKIKQMSVLIGECANQLVVKLKELAESQGKIDAKEQFSVFTMDVIARCAFGMKLDRLGEKDDPFMTKAKEVSSPPNINSPIILLPIIFPNFMAKFAETLFFSPSMKYLISVLEDVIQQRGNSTEHYHDFIEITTETIANYTKEVGGQSVSMWSKEEVDEIVVAQSLLFLLAGFDTTAITLTNAAFLLAKNPDVQEKLYEKVLEKYGQFDDANHDMISDFPYLDHVINEVLRMCPPAVRIERSCNKDFTHRGIHIKEGTIVSVPTYALHYDEEYYPDPYKFNPDRWDPASPIKPNPYTFMPFGMGPRNCIGMRFALEEMKIALTTIVKNFRLFSVAETLDELQFESGFGLGVVKPLHTKIGIETR